MEQSEAKKVCPCGTAIVKHNWETLKQFEKREKSGFCRSKCSRIHPKLRRGSFNIEAPIGAVAPAPERRLVVQSAFQAGKAYKQVFLGSFFKVVPEDDPKYLKWIRSLPCMIPNCGRKAEAHHQNPEGHGQKGATCSDKRALPLCWGHHTGGGFPSLEGSYHAPARITGRAFLAHYGIDPEKKILQLNAEYDMIRSGE